MSVRKLCHLFGLNRQQYYQDHCPSPYEDRNVQRSLAIEAILKVFPGYRYRLIIRALIRAGQTINHKPVWRIMGKAGLTRHLKRRHVYIFGSRQIY